MSLSPVTQRTEVLDVLRGFAIFGMFTVNMTADALWNDTFGELEPWSGTVHATCQMRCNPWHQ